MGCCKESCDTACVKSAVKTLRVLATIKQEYWVEAIKRYVIPGLYFVEYSAKPLLSENKNIEFYLTETWRVSEVFQFDPFESITVSTT